MIKALFLSALAVASVAHASECTDAIQRASTQCGEYDGIVQVVHDYGMPDQCTRADSPDGRQQYVTAYSHLNAVLTLDIANLCKASFAIVPSPVLEMKNLAGRVAMRGADKRLYIVARDGSVSELLNKSGNSLVVEDFQIDGATLKVQSNSGGFDWNEDTLLKKLNGQSRKAHILGFGRN